MYWAQQRQDKLSINEHSKYVRTEQYQTVKQLTCAFHSSSCFASIYIKKTKKKQQQKNKQKKNKKKKKQQQQIQKKK